MRHEDDLQHVVDFYQSIALDRLGQMDALYTPDAFFKDPFNEVHGAAAIQQIFVHMFRQVDAPRFLVTTRIAQGSEAFMTWEFRFRMKRFSQDEQCIRGASHLRFSSDGRVAFHRDYWDAAEELYEKIPVLGGLMRVLNRVASS